MGLDTTHDCWHGPYSMFHRWRVYVARAIGLDLNAMAGFGGHTAWDANEPLAILLSHSDSDGTIVAADCASIAARLEALSAAITAAAPDNEVERVWVEHKTEAFIAGLRLAASRGEDVAFH